MPCGFWFYDFADFFYSKVFYHCDEILKNRDVCVFLCDWELFLCKYCDEYAFLF